MSDVMEISSHKGPYQLFTDVDVYIAIRNLDSEKCFWVVDKNISLLNPELFDQLKGQVLVVTADERAKDIRALLPIIEELLSSGLKRDCELVAVGGGVIQDIVCFISSVYMRGIKWRFFPTTLLAQADSCIGSKSSINLGEYKNTLGTFHAPAAIYQSNMFLRTLSATEIFSGIGEILKVCAIHNKALLDKAVSDICGMQSDLSTLQKYVKQALEVKQAYIEVDEFDQKERIVFNLGHSFWHAIESATNFQVQHGIAVCIGLDLAFYVAGELRLIDKEVAFNLSSKLAPSYQKYTNVCFNIPAFFKALKRDKKNSGADYGLILPHGINCEMRLTYVPQDDSIKDTTGEWINSVWQGAVT